MAKLLWDTLITMSLIVIIYALLAEFFFHPPEYELELLHNLEIVALSFLFVELAYDFYKAKDKKNFVRREWLLIISFLPFGTIFRLMRFVRASRVVQALSSATGRLARALRIESVGVKSAQGAVHASKVGRFLPKLGRAIRPIAQFLSKKDKRLEEVRGR